MHSVLQVTGLRLEHARRPPGAPPLGRSEATFESSSSSSSCHRGRLSHGRGSWERDIARLAQSGSPTLRLSGQLSRGPRPAPVTLSPRHHHQVVVSESLALGPGLRDRDSDSEAVQVGTPAAAGGGGSWARNETVTPDAAGPCAGSDVTSLADLPQAIST